MLKRLFIASSMLVAALMPGYASQSSLVTPSAPLPMTSLATFLDNALQSLGSCNQGSSAPANGAGGAAFAGECWANSSANPWAFNYTPDGTNWVKFGTLNTSTLAWVPYSVGTALTVGTSGANLCLLNANCVFSGAVTFSSALTFSGLSAGTQVSCLGLNSSNAVVLAGCGGGASAITVGTTTIAGGTSGEILYQNGASPTGTIGELPVTGTAGSVVLSTNPTLAGFLSSGIATIDAGSGALPIINTRGNFGIQISTADSFSPSLQFNAFFDGIKGYDVIVFQSTQGTRASPTATLSGDILGNIQAAGYTGSQYGSGAYIEFNATQPWTGTANGEKFSIYTIANNATGAALAATFDQDQSLTVVGAIEASNLSITSGKTLTASNTLTLSGTDSSTLNIGVGGTLGSLAFLSAAPAGTLTGSTLASGVTASSLTSVGTLTALAVSGNITSNITGSTQCVHANSVGVLSGTGSDCGSGGGGVSSVGNASADTTLTIAGTGSGPWTGTVTAKLNLANANTWSAVQTYGAGDLVLSGAVNGDIGTFNSSHALQDSGTLLASLAPLVSPSFTTPALGVATGTSLALNGATLGATQKLAVTGDAQINATSTSGVNGLLINANAASAPSAVHAGGVMLNGEDDNFPAYYAYAYGTSSPDGSYRVLFEGYSANGTGASPTASNSNDELVRFSGRGYGATGFTGTVGAMSIIAAQNFSDTAQGTFTAFRTTPLNAPGGGTREWPPVIGSFAPSGALIVGGLEQQATFTGSQSGNTLTVSAVTGTIAIGQIVQIAGVPMGEVIVSGSGTSWIVTGSATISGESMTSGVPFAIQTANDLGTGYVEAQTALALFGSTSGYSTVEAPASGGGVLTLPAGTTTLAGLGTTQVFTGANTFNTLTVLASGATAPNASTSFTQSTNTTLNQTITLSNDTNSSELGFRVTNSVGVNTNLINGAGRASVYTTSTSGLAIGTIGASPLVFFTGGTATSDMAGQIGGTSHGWFIGNGTTDNGQGTLELQSDLYLLGSSTGTTAIATANASATNYTWTVQAATDTFVGLATADTLTNKTLTSSTDVLGGVTMTLGSDATGDMYYRNSSGVLARLAVVNGDCIVGSGGLPTFGSCSGSAAVTSVTGSGGTNCSPTTGAVTCTSQTGAAYLLGQSHIPLILVSSGTMGNNGALSSITALPLQYPNAYVYLPSGAISSGSAAGWYYTVFSSTTAGTVYNNTYTSGTPQIPGTPTPFSTTGPGAYTQTTNTLIPSYTLVIPGNTIGANGSIRAFANNTYTADTNGKTFAATYGSFTLGTETLSTSTQQGTNGIAMFSNRGVTNAQIVMSNPVLSGMAGNGTSTTQTYAYTFGSVDSTSNQNLTWKLELASGADNLILETITVELLPGVT